MATLWQFLILICFAMPVAGGLASARIARVGVSGYALAITVGLLVGFFCSWIMLATHKIFVRNLDENSNSGRSKSDWYFRAFYLTKFVWIVVALFLGRWVSTLALRLTF